MKAALIFILTCSQAIAATKYCTAGAGTGVGSEADPWGTLQEALTECSDGDVILCSGTFSNEAMASGGALNGKSVTFDGQGTAAWTYSTANGTTLITINSTDAAFTLTLTGWTITRTNATGGYFCFQSNATDGSKNLVISNSTIDTNRHFIYQGAGGASDLFNVTISNSTVRYGINMFIANASHYFGAVSLNNVTVGKSAGASGSQGAVVALSGGYMNSLSITNGSDINMEPTAATSQPMFSFGSNLLGNLTLTDSTFSFSAQGWTGTASPIELRCGGAVSVTGSTFKDEIGGADTPAYADNYSFVKTYTLGATDVVSRNTFNVFSSTSGWPNVGVEFQAGASTDVDIDSNAITSGASGIVVDFSGSGSVVNIRNNTITLPSTGGSVKGITVGTTADSAPTYNTTDLTISGNSITATGTTYGALIYLRREVQGGTITNNTIIGKQTSTETSYGMYVQSDNLTITYNKVHCRAPFTGVGMSGSTVQYNSFYAIDQGAKGAISSTAHNSTYYHHDNTVRYNIVVIGTGEHLTGGSVFSDSDVYKGMDDVTWDYNWYGADSGITLANLNGVDQDTLSEFQASWDDLDANDAEYTNVAGNDAHSTYVSSPEIFVDPINGDFTPRKYVYGWGAVAYPGAFYGADGSHWAPPIFSVSGANGVHYR